MTPHRGAALSALAGAAAVAFLDLTAVSLALPSIQRELGAPSGQVQWVMTAYFVALAVAIAAGGRVADIVGARRAFLTGIALFALASGLAGLAQGIGWLIAARFVQGLGAALMLPASQALAVQTFGVKRLGAALGVILGISSLALMVGPLLGGALVEWLDWRAVFFINLPIAAAIAVASGRAFAASPRAKGRELDLAGCLLLAVSAGGIVTAASDPGSAGPWLALAGIAAGFGLVRRERRARDPILAPELLRSPSFAGSLGTVFLLQFAPVALIVYGSIYLQDAVGLSALDAGLAVVPATLAFLGASLLGGRLADRISARGPTLAGAALITLALAWIALWAGVRSYPPLIPGLVAFGAGLGLCAAPINAALLAAAPSRTAGSTAGLIATVRQLGSALAVAGLGAVALAAERSELGSGAEERLSDALARHGASALAGTGSALEQLRDAIAAGTAATMWVGAAVTLLACGLTIRYVPRHRGPADTALRADHADQRNVSAGL